MKAGRLKYRLVLLKPVRAVSYSGADDTLTWEETATVWAERQKLTGRLVEEAGELFSDYSAFFNIRDAHHVEENWRVRQLGGNLYTVTNVVPNIDRGFLTLQCERVNE